MLTQLNQNHEPYTIDKKGSQYVDHLHKLLEEADKVMEEVLSLNPNYNVIGHGKLANMQELANRFRNKLNPKTK